MKLSCLLKGVRHSAVTTTTMSPHPTKHQEAHPYQQHRQPLRHQMPPPLPVGQPPRSPLLGYSSSSEHSPTLHGGIHPQIRDSVHHAPYSSTLQQSPGQMLHRPTVSTNASSVSLMKALSSPTTPGKYPSHLTRHGISYSLLILSLLGAWSSCA